MFLKRKVDLSRLRISAPSVRGVIYPWDRSILFVSGQHCLALPGCVVVM